MLSDNEFQMVNSMLSKDETAFDAEERALFDKLKSEKLSKSGPVLKPQLKIMRPTNQRNM